LIFEPYTQQMYDATFKWIAERGVFGVADMGAGNYVELVSAGRL
jgi:hypothetical protein